MHEHLPERDWKHLRAMEAIALDRYCTRALEEAAETVQDAEASQHQRYLRLYAVVQERNTELARAFDDMRRSTAIHHLAAWIRLDLLTQDELATFSPETLASARVWASGEAP